MAGAGWLAAAGDLLLGASCPGCDAPGWGLCDRCRRDIAGAPYLTRPDPSPDDFPLTATAGPYGATMRRLVSAHKERQVLSLTPVLAARLAVAVACLVDRAPGGSPLRLVLVPVPSAPSAVRARGLDATWALARGAVRSGSGPRAGPRVRTVVAQRLLAQSRRLQDQAGLDAAARRLNLAGGFRVSGRRPEPGSVVVVVDDLVTTGSSLGEAARALRAAGIPVLGAATVAATVRSRSSGPRG